MKSGYYIYGHYLDNKCIYIGSNCNTNNPNRAYDFSNRNKDYAEVTKGRKQDIKVKILKEFTYEELNNKSVQSEEMKFIREYHDRGEALCSHQDYRGKNNSQYGNIGNKNPMYGKHHTLESKYKISLHKSKYNISEETREHYRQANLGNKNPMYGIKRKHINNGKINKNVKLEELNYYLSQGWKEGWI